MGNTKPKTGTERTIRSAECDWEINGKELGDVESVGVRVLFYAPTIKELRDQSEYIASMAKENPQAIYWQSEGLIKRLHSIPYFNVGIGHANKLDLDWLESQDTNNLKSLKDAIDEALTPKAPQAK